MGLLNLWKNLKEIESRRKDRKGERERETIRTYNKSDKWAEI